MLTERERQVLNLLADGLQKKEIAVRLRIATDTVKAHTVAIFDKLGPRNAAGAVAEGFHRGLLLPRSPGVTLLERIDRLGTALAELRKAAEGIE